MEVEGREENEGSRLDRATRHLQSCGVLACDLAWVQLPSSLQ